MKIRVIGREKLVLIAASGSTLAPGSEMSVRQLAEIPLILKGAGCGPREMVIEYLRKYKVHPQIALESSNVAVIKEFVRQDDGVAFMDKDADRRRAQRRRVQDHTRSRGIPVFEVGTATGTEGICRPRAWAFLRLLKNPRTCHTSADVRPRWAAGLLVRPAFAKKGRVPDSGASPSPADVENRKMPCKIPPGGLH